MMSVADLNLNDSPDIVVKEIQTKRARRPHSCENSSAIPESDEKEQSLARTHTATLLIQGLTTVLSISM